MGLAIYNLAGPNDNRALAEFAQSLGLRMFPPLMEQPEIQPSDEPRKYPFCYLSFLSREELHPYGNPPRIGPATDPLIEFDQSSFHQPDILVIGRLYCETGGAFFKLRRPYFAKMAKWIRSHWKKSPDGLYIGPEGQSLLDSGVKMANFPPGTKIRIKYI